MTQDTKAIMILGNLASQETAGKTPDILAEVAEFLNLKVASPKGEDTFKSITTAIQNDQDLCTKFIAKYEDACIGDEEA